ncbi:sodium-independent sulfate anion transporter-like isoform X2 [Babylonia areolata]|uniref:sodium-independent sulfate anion transporter-like isoform X2 n=1 Tax=Babylonia areolata TaxID=304850 RepID=UPI003FD109B7
MADPSKDRPTMYGSVEERVSNTGSVNTADELNFTTFPRDRDREQDHEEHQALLVRVEDPHKDGAMPLGVKVTRRLKEATQNCCTLDTLRRRLPILCWLPKYSCQDFQSDMISGLTVGLTVIPQGLAYAGIAGLDPQYGLYSAFMGCFVYMFLGTSKDVTLGPTAIMSLMTSIFATSPISKDPTLALVLTLMCGLVQLLMGVLNLGILVNYISHPVINSFTSAAAITIGFGQVKNILGLEHIPRDFMPMVYHTFANIPKTKKWDLVMGLVSMVLLYFLKKLRAKKWGDEELSDSSVSLPVMVARKIVWLAGTGANAIVVISAAGIAASLWLNDIKVITLTGEITPGLPPFEPPDFSNGNMTTSDIFSNIGVGFIIVPFLGLVESIAIGKAFARVNNYKIDPTQELIAIGAANIFSSFVHSYPITGSFSRTAVNSQSGVRTPASGLFTGSLILLVLAFLVPYCYYIPKSALAAVIIMAVMQMVDYKIVLILWRTDKWDFFIHLVTLVGSLCVGIEYGILIGIAVSLLLLLYPMARPQLKVKVQQNLVIIQPDQGLFFPAIEYIEAKVMAMAFDNDTPKAVILDMVHISGLDYSSLHGMRSMILEGRRKGVCIVLCQTNLQVTNWLVKEDIPDLKIYSSVEEALEYLRTQEHADGEDKPFAVHLE